MMSRALSSYLRKRAIRGPWTLTLPPLIHPPTFLVAIPSLAESQTLPRILNSLTRQPHHLLNKLLVGVVVNNSAVASDDIRQNNLQTLDFLSQISTPFPLAIVDACSPGLELPERQAGVGLARRIIMDLLLENSNDQGVFCCLDADTEVNPDYLMSIQEHFQNRDHQAAVLGFRHRPSDLPELEDAIRVYEDWLVRTAEGLQSAGSPYAYPAVGSTMVCRTLAYAAVGGMPRNKAAEDFYFLQELAKFHRVDWLRRELVYPDPRAEQRVHLGTGMRMQQVFNGFDLQSLFFPERGFKLLKLWLDLGTSKYGVVVDELLREAEILNPSLPGFLEKENIRTSWPGIQKSSPSPNHFVRQFHRWFDGLKTMRLLKRVQDGQLDSLGNRIPS